MDAETMTEAAKLPPELWVEILARLPAEDLVRFRCVSKTCRSIIDDPDFVHMHLHKFKDNSKNLFLCWENYLDSVFESELKIGVRLSDDLFRNCAEIMSMNYSLPLLAFEHLGYVNGLILFSMYRVDTVTNSSDEFGRLSSNPCYKIYLDLYLFNPSIRKFLLLPPLPSHPGRREMIFSGFDHVRNDHKVIAVIFPVRAPQGLSSPGFISVYELSTQCWRVNSSSSIHVHNKASMKRGVYARGFMHWIYYDTSLVRKPRNYTHIVSFDFGTEEFSYSSLPGERDGEFEILTFPFVLGDSFAVLDMTTASTCIWVLKMSGDNGRESWIRSYSGPSDLDNYGFFQKHRDDIDYVLYVEKIGKFLLAVKAKVMFYDMETCMLEGFISQCFCVMEPYVESLLLSKGIGSPFFNFPHPKDLKEEID